MSENSPHLTSDQLVDLAHGLMSEDVAVVALAHLHQCAQCEADLQEISRLQEVLRAKEPPARGAEPRSRTTRRPVRRIGVAALAFAAVLAFVLLRPVGDGSPDAYWLPLAADSSALRSLASSGSNEYDAGLRAYAARDAAQARRLLESATVPPQLEPERALYLASAEQITGDCGSALTTLDDIQVQFLPPPARGQARWIQYLCLGEVGRDAEAAQLLQLLTEEPGDIGERARKEAADLSGRNR